ncbi:MAG: dephospho-CoA kinase [Rikenellaceae bacterium]
MKKVGITGGIGSGKTTICKALHDRYGAPVYYADEAAKELMRDDPTVKAKIETIFGKEAYLGGRVNAPYISAKVFNDKKLLDMLNEAVHGAVMDDFERWAKCQEANYVVCEAAVLIESGWHKSLDVVVVVTAPLELRIERVVSRDGVKREQVLSRINSQLQDDKRIEYADFVITADGSRSVEDMIKDLHKKLTN